METPIRSDGGAAAPASTDEARAKKPSLTKTLPSDRLTFDRQIASLRAFGAVSESNEGKPVTNQAAGEVAKLAAGTIVVTNAWFVDAGLLTRTGDGFTVAPEVVSFLAAEHGISPETAPEKLRPIFETHWATQLLIPRLKVGTMEMDAARKVLGEACNATREHIPRLDMLIEFLVYVGLIRKEGNQIRLGGNAKHQEPPPIKSGNSNGHDSPQDVPGLETYTLTLHAGSKRRVIIQSPPEVSAVELKRIQDWLSFQLIIKEEV